MAPVAPGASVTSDLVSRPTASAVDAALAAVTTSLPGGGEDRPGQLEMATRVARSIESGRHLVVQAGTGTGKSLAYLVPAVLSERTVVVATATKALQDQLATKDLPALSRALDRPIRFAVLKGRSNYLCLQRAGEVGGRGVQQDLVAAAPDGDAGPGAGTDGEAGAGGEGGAGAWSRPEPIDAGRLVSQVRLLLDWAGRTPSGDRADLPFEPHPRAWAMVSVGPRECPGAHRCPEGPRCFAERARAAAAEAEVVVVNTHLYGAHLASGGQVLPPHDAVVFDEAHEVEEIMTASLGVDLSPGRLTALHSASRALLDPDEAPSADLGDVADALRSLLADRVGRRVLTARQATGRPAGDDGAGPGTPGRPGQAEPEGRERAFFAPPPAQPADGAAAGADAELASLLELATSRVERLRALLRSGADATGARDEAARRTRALTAADHLAGDLDRLATRTDAEVAWVDGTARAPVLRLSPVDVAPVLAGPLWGALPAVLTSATIPPRLPERLGMPEGEVDVVDVGSPFDYRSHALLYVARHLPDRRSPAAEPAVFDELHALIRAAGGRTLALFTSRRATEAAAAALRPRLDVTLLVQGDLPKGRLLEAFAAEESSCLFATLGFWQGVDVPGRSLSLVTLDRLPFGRPDDPLLEARRERAGADAFRLIDLPRAAALLAQGVGRLIRSAEDHGVVAVLDPRLATAAYRRVLLDALPPMRRTVDRGEVAAFLARVLGTPPGQ